MPDLQPEKSDTPLPRSLQPVAMLAESGCSRCDRRILLLEKACLDENYAAVCIHCVASAYTIKANLTGNIEGPGEAVNE